MPALTSSGTGAHLDYSMRNGDLVSHSAGIKALWPVLRYLCQHDVNTAPWSRRQQVLLILRG